MARMHLYDGRDVVHEYYKRSIIPYTVLIAQILTLSTRVKAMYLGSQRIHMRIEQSGCILEVLISTTYIYF